MRVASLANGSRSQRTFIFALAFLLAIATAQIIGGLLFYLLRPREVPARHSIPPVARHFAPPAVSPRANPGAAVSPAPQNPPAAAVTKPVARPTPGVAVADEIVQVAKALRDRGDTANAIAKLQQAMAIAPDNPEVLAQLAMTYESMQLFDRSNETWHKLQSLGPAAGPLYELADLKLRVGVPVAGIPGSTGASPEAESSSPNESAGIPDGSDFGISQIAQAKQNDPDAETKLTLRVGVKVRPGIEIDHTKVKIQVFFYDVVDNDQVVLTDADVSYDWVTRGHDWKETDTEVLDVTYFRPKKNDVANSTAMGDNVGPVPDSVEKALREQGKKKPAGAELLPTNAGGKHQYLGYIVRVYYNNQLQAVRADPTRLLNLFPPPFTAPSP